MQYLILAHVGGGIKLNDFPCKYVTGGKRTGILDNSH